MPVYCEGQRGQGCPHDRRAIKGSKPPRCRTCTPSHLRSHRGGLRFCHVQGCGNGIAQTEAKPVKKLRTAADVANSFHFCSACLNVVKIDARLSLESAAKRKIRAWLATDVSFLLVVRRYGRPHIMEKRASSLLKNLGFPFLNAICLEDKPSKLHVYLEHYARAPSHFVFVPRGCSDSTNFLSKVCVGLLAPRQLIHVVDDNLKDLRIESSSSASGISVHRKHLQMLLEKAQDVVFKEQASLFGVKCYKRRDSDLPSDSLDVLSNWSRNSDELMRYSTYSRLVFGGIFGFRPSGLLALSIPSVFGPQDDVARSMAHYLQDGVVVLFDKYCAVKTTVSYTHLTLPTTKQV